MILMQLIKRDRNNKEKGGARDSKQKIRGGGWCREKE
jgi:hypothetical protein